MIRRLNRVFMVLLSFAAGLFITGVLCPIANITSNAKRASFQKNRMKSVWMQMVAYSINLKVERCGTLIDGAALMVSNHISWIDIVAIGKYVPGCFIAKSDILKWPVMGFLTKQSGNVFIKRGNKQQVRQTTEQMVWLLKQDAKIIAFPEGTTGDGTHLLPFHASLFQPALLTKLPVQPIAIEYLSEAKRQAPYIDDDIFITHLWRILALPTINVRLNFLPILESKDCSRQYLKRESWQQINHVLTDTADSKSIINY